MTRTFHIIDWPQGARRVVGVIHEARAESAGAERAVEAARVIAWAAGDGSYRAVEQVGRGEIAVVGADGPVAA